MFVDGKTLAKRYIKGVRLKIANVDLKLKENGVYLNDPF